MGSYTVEITAKVQIGSAQVVVEADSWEHAQELVLRQGRDGSLCISSLEDIPYDAELFDVNIDRVNCDECGGEDGDCDCDHDDDDECDCEDCVSVDVFAELGL